MAAGRLEGLLKELLKILGWGSLAFMVLAMGQEWRYFADAWFGTGASIARLSEEQRREAGETVHRFLALLGHFYASGGDARFAERMPADPGMIEELGEDVRFLGRQHLVQTHTLHRLEIMAVQAAGEGAAEVHTREFWTIGLRHASGSRTAQTPRAQVVRAKYLLSYGAAGWTVEGWDLAPGEAGEDESSPR